MASNQLANGAASVASSAKEGVQMAYDKLYEYYNYGMGTTRSAVDKTFSAAAHTGALSLGLAIVTAQMGLIATTSCTNAFLSSLIYTKTTGQAAVQGVQKAEKVAEQRISDAIQMTVELAKVPKSKVLEHTNSFLDIANTVFDRLGFAQSEEPVDSTISERITFLSHRVTGGLVNQANNNVIDPVRTKIMEFAQQMQRNLILADYVKQRREWVNEKVENLSAGVLEWKQKIEQEAQQYCISPEEMLVRSIRRTSALLNDNLITLHKQGNELAGKETADRLENATHFIQQIDENFSKAENIYDITDEVIVEAKQKVNEMAQWTTSLIVREDPRQQ